MDFLSKIITDNVSPFDAEVNHSGIYSYRPDVQLSQCICIIHYVYTCVIIYVLRRIYILNRIYIKSVHICSLYNHARECTYI